MRFPDDQLDMFSQEKHPHLHDFNEERTDRVASSHGDGEHYRVGDDWLKLYGLFGGA
jgi:hypothetical protein